MRGHAMELTPKQIEAAKEFFSEVAALNVDPEEVAKSMIFDCLGTQRFIHYLAAHAVRTSPTLRDVMPVENDSPGK